MSTGADRVARRDLRRAIGPEALKVIEQHDTALANQAQALGVALPNLTKTVTRVNALASEVLALRAQVALLEKEQGAAKECWRGFYGASLWARLRWLVRWR